MPTLNQLLKYPRKKKFRSIKKAALESNPQKRGLVVKTVIRKPKKPNSANRKLALVKLVNKRRIYAYIGGMVGKQPVQDFSTVLIRGGRVKDLPGVKYKLIHNVYDFPGVSNRQKARSKYGTKRFVKK